MEKEKSEDQNNLNEEDKSNFDENPYLKFHSGSDLA